MKERPVLFSGEMVRAILEGRKTQTRRVAKSPFFNRDVYLAHRWTVAAHPGGGFWAVDAPDLSAGFMANPRRETGFPCPYGAVGDRLWVRERHALIADGPLGIIPGVVYHADSQARWNVPMKDGLTVYNYEKPDIWKWRPSIHTRREHSRITLEITAVRVERLREITHRDALAEGVEYDISKEDGAPLARYRTLWNTLNEKRGFGWDANPWVWCISFRKVESPA